MFTDYLHSEQYGVPQKRTRFIMIGIRADLPVGDIAPFNILASIRSDFLNTKKLPITPVSVKDAIGDLEVSKSSLIYHSGSKTQGFKQIDYKPPRRLTAYQKLMREGLKSAKPNSLRIARHRPETIEKFKAILELCKPGKGLSEEHKKALGTRKQVISVLNPFEPSRTLTTLPDDLLHYSEPRILTVRENARIQSFPDDYVFKGKYTTGGLRRTQECPRYTQVGNAVPPLLAEVLGYVIRNLG